MTEGFITILGHRLEYRLIPAAKPNVPFLVFLHEGLGSIGLWRDFPDRVAAATGCAVLLYSRYGFGRSDILIEEPRKPDYLHAEALDVLPRVLDHFGIVEPILIGHSDGASIALIYAAASGQPLKGIVAEAAHVFVEEITLAGIRDAVHAWNTTELPSRLARHHTDAERTFRGWHEIWLAPAFRDWNIEHLLPAITCPTLVIQGEGDEYGTLEQVEKIVRQVSGPVEKLALANCGHTPHRDQAETVLNAIMWFVAKCGP